MANEKPKFRLRLNLFDGIILVLALAVGAFLAWNYLKPAAGAAGGEPVQQQTVRYTIRITWAEGLHELVEEGDQLYDNRRNYELGTVVSVQAKPATELILNEIDHRFVMAELTGYEDVFITLEAPCAADSQSITVGGGFVLWVGSSIYVRGEGYLGTATVTAIELEGAK